MRWGGRDNLFKKYHSDQARRSRFLAFPPPLYKKKERKKKKQVQVFQPRCLVVPRNDPSEETVGLEPRTGQGGRMEGGPPEWAMTWLGTVPFSIFIYIYSDMCLLLLIWTIYRSGLNFPTELSSKFFVVK